MSKYHKIKLIIVLFLGLLLIFILYRFSENGRYVFWGKMPLILDTQTGKIYNTQEKVYYDVKDYKKWEMLNTSKK